MKVSERGLATTILVFVIIVGTFLLTVINNIQEVATSEWQENIGIKIEVHNE